jgi:ribonuclease T2
VPLYSPLVLFARSAAFATLVAFTSADGRAGDFDFYVLSLTWTPTYCATADNPDGAQCGRPYGFLVHGFWPEYETGYPEYCASSFPRGLKRSTLDAIAGVMPSASLAHYEWRKHGLCSGLDEGGYFALLRDAAKKVVIPDVFRKIGGRRSLSPATIEAAFAKVNPRLTTDAMAIKCGGNQLTEVRICFTKELDFRRCLAVNDDTCRASSVSIPPP